VEAKKVNVELVEDLKESKKTFQKISLMISRIKLFVAIILDLVDFLIGWIPIVNTLWDLVTFIILIIILKNKKLALVSLIELPFFGLPPFSILDMFIPIATITVLIDNNLSKIQRN